MTFAKIKMDLKPVLIVIFTILSTYFYSQNSTLNPETFKPDAEKEKAFFPYLAVRHGGAEATQNWKKSNTLQYYKELWYYCESFSVKTDHLSTGEVLNPAIIDISRFETSRKQSEDAIVILPGFKDALILKPINQLMYQPDYVK
ncbi:hypothetical protein CNR22_07435 [Sphingobacteriaceae bacterium]|nr:hypothetical protein CNR22_07435 [Sphingobacteriaceae bacterium]